MQPIRPDADDIAHENEPPEIRGLTKKAIHARLNNEFYIPDCASRGVTRQYLGRVTSGENFRVRLLDFKRFNAELTPAQKKKAPILNGPDALKKINRLLQETNRQPLGFADGVFPEETWFLNIARYIDRGNISGIFLEGLPNIPFVDSESQRMTVAKRNAEQFLLGDRDLLANKTIFHQVEEVWESQKRLAGKRNDLQVLFDHGRAMEAKINDEQAQLQSKLLQASITIFAHGNGLNNADEIFHEQNGNNHRLQLNEITQL